MSTISRRRTQALEAAGPLRPFGSIAARIVSNLTFRRQVRRLHAMGPRVTAEFIAELIAKTGSLERAEDQFDKYLRLDPKVIAALGADRFPPAPLHEVRR